MTHETTAEQEAENQFNQKKNLDLIKHFGKIFSKRYDEPQEDDNKEIEPDKRIMFLDAANVCAVIPKTKKFEALMKATFEWNEEKPPKIPTLSYFSDGKRENKSKYGGEYLKILCELGKHYDSVTLKVANDYPLTAETEDFIFILAPRVE